MILTAERARELFRYDPETGVVTRLITTSSRARQGYTLDTVGSQGYLVVRVDYVLYYVHRLVWLLQTGSWPEYYIDHIDRNKLNNSWNNLRDVTCTENMQNVISMQNGVSFHTPSGFWYARVQSWGKVKYLGCRKNKTEAEQLYNSYVAKHAPHKLSTTNQ